VIGISGGGGSVTVTVNGAYVISITNSEAANDTLTINLSGGNDTVDARGLINTSIRLTLNGGTGDDFLLGSTGNDTINGENGDDFLFGDDGNDVIDGGNNVDTADGGVIGLRVVEALRVAKRGQRRGDGAGRVQRVGARLPELRVDELIGVRERAAALERREPAFDAFAERAERVAREQVLPALQVGVDGQDRHAMRAQPAREGRDRQVRRRRIARGRINQRHRHGALL